MNLLKISTLGICLGGYFFTYTTLIVVVEYGHHLMVFLNIIPSDCSRFGEPACPCSAYLQPHSCIQYDIAPSDATNHALHDWICCHLLFHFCNLFFVQIAFTLQNCILLCFLTSKDFSKRYFLFEKFTYCSHYFLDLAIFSFYNSSHRNSL